MFEVHEWLYDAAKAYWVAGGFINTCIGYALFLLDIWYLMHLISIPFYVRDIARNTRRVRA